MSSLWNRIVKAIIDTRFIPLEVVLAFSSVLHGLWMLFPSWVASTGVSITGAPRVIEVVFGASFATIGAVILLLLALSKDRFRSQLSMVQFVYWAFAAGLAFSASAAGIVWISLLTITISAAIVYLNVSVGES